jgi:hypothetical protein
MKLLTSRFWGTILITAGAVLFVLVLYDSVRPCLPVSLQPEWSFFSARSRRPVKPSAPVTPEFSVADTIKTEQYGRLKEFLKDPGGHLVEGLAVVESSSRRGNYDSWAGMVDSWWEYSEDPLQQVAWVSAKVPEKKPVVLVFSGVLGLAEGEAELRVAGNPVLAFNTGDGPETEEYEKDGYRLNFFVLRVKANRERQGVFCLRVPEDSVSAGEPVHLQVSGYRKTGSGNSFFMLSDIPDTLKRLKLK